MATNIELSIIIPTLGRKKEVDELLKSLKYSNYDAEYEIIVVDQNENNLIDNLCKEYALDMNLVQHKVCFKGLSKAKNYGIDHAKGKYICFPDDDAEFSNDTITTALNILKHTNYDCIFGKCIDKKNGKDSVMKFNKSEQKLTLENFEGAFVEATMFANKSLFDNHKYDEKMGVGCIFGSQEGYDLVLRLLKANKEMYYYPNIVFYHPNKIETRTTSAEIQRAFYYSCGLGYLCKKHQLRKKYLKRLIKLLIGIPILAIFKHKELKYYNAQKLGLLIGYKYLS